MLNANHRRATRTSRSRARPLIAAALAAVTLLLLAFPATEAAAADTATLDDVLGLTRESFVSSVEANWASSYEGTPYEGWYLSQNAYPSWYDGMFWPRGNPSPTGHVGMNCGGFVSRAITDAGANDYNTSFMADWWNGAPNASDGRGAAAGHYANARTFWRLAKTYGVEMYEFANKQDLLASGRAVKGDIIVMIDDADSGGVDDYGNYHPHAQDSHIGIFWGDTPNDDKFLHSSHDVSITAETTISGCVLSSIQPKCWGSRFYLVKFRDFGGIRLEKASSLPDLSADNANYCLEGAVYGVFDDRSGAETHAAGNARMTLTTDASGTWDTGRMLDPGTYYVAETGAPKGYALDGSVYEVEVKAGTETSVNGTTVRDTPQHELPSVWAFKRDAQTAGGYPQGSAKLEGAQFEVRYFDGCYDAASLPATATRTWIVKTGEDGIARVSDELKVSGDEFYRDSAGRIVLPLGTIAVREVKAPDGYLLSDNAVHVATIASTGTSPTSVTPFLAETFTDEVQRGGVAVGKIDRQHGSALPQGSASLIGATFEVVSENDAPVVVGGVEYARGAKLLEITTEETAEGYTAATALDALPVGTYSLRETSSSPGYLLDETSRAWNPTFTVDSDGFVADLTSAQSSVGNLVVRGDFEFSKVDGQTMGRLGGIPFMLTSNTTGESHVVVTDENGMLSTAASWNPHTALTNSNDAAVSYAVQPDESAEETSHGEAPQGSEADDDAADSAQDAETPTASGTDDPKAVEEGPKPAEAESTPKLLVDETLLNSAAGVWFSGRSDASCAPDDDMGALPYDTYTVRELPVSANEGRELVSFIITVSRNARELDLGTIDDNAVPEEPEKTEEPEPQPEPHIGTTLHAADTDEHVVSADGNVELVDSIAYEGLTPGKQYLVEGVLHKRLDDGSDAGLLRNASEEAVTGHATFTPDEASGSVDVTFEFAAKDIAPNDVVAFEKLSLDGEVIASHEDIGDEGQTVHFVEKVVPPAVSEDKPDEPAPAEEGPKPSASAQKEAPQGKQGVTSMPKLGDAALTAVLIVLALVLLAAGMGTVSYARMRRSAPDAQGPKGLAARRASAPRTPTSAPRARGSRRIQIERGPAHRK